MTAKEDCSEIEIDIVYEQRGIVVFNKPPGLLTQGPPGIDSLENRAKRFLRQRDDLGKKFYFTAIHRLDRPVSGLVAFARNVRAAQRVSAQFQQGTVSKTYVAILERELQPAAGTLTDHMRKIPDEAKSEIVASDHPDAKHAALEYKTIRQDNVSRVTINLLTGRTHQIRLQFATRGHPILGDTLYGSTTEFGPQVDDLRKRQIALHSWKLRFRHPIDDEDVDLTLPPPSAWDRWLDGTELPDPEAPI